MSCWEAIGALNSAREQADCIWKAHQAFYQKAETDHDQCGDDIIANFTPETIGTDAGKQAAELYAMYLLERQSAKKTMEASQEEYELWKADLTAHGRSCTVSCPYRSDDVVRTDIAGLLEIRRRMSVLEEAYGRWEVRPPSQRAT